MAEVIYLPPQASQAPKVPAPDATADEWAAFWRALADWAPVYRASWGRPA